MLMNEQFEYANTWPDCGEVRRVDFMLSTLSRPTWRFPYT
ncbi:hypothetical protein L521_4728 [Bordetella bronchiseptica MBORD698]|nr:hypothetical protein L521_4728 [Bordetella bronchiseptica MBORD698]